MRFCTVRRFYVPSGKNDDWLYFELFSGRFLYQFPEPVCCCSYLDYCLVRPVPVRRGDMRAVEMHPPLPVSWFAIGLGFDHKNAGRGDYHVVEVKGGRRNIVENLGPLFTQ